MEQANIESTHLRILERPASKEFAFEEVAPESVRPILMDSENRDPLTGQSVEVTFLHQGDRSLIDTTFFRYYQDGKVGIIAMPPRDIFIAEWLNREAVLDEVEGDFDYDMHRLSQAEVAVIGVSSVGDQALFQLSHSGIGKLTFGDPDEVDVHNLSRMPHATILDIGRNKTDVASRGIFFSNPFIDQKTFRDGFTSGNADEFIHEGTSVVVDACDNIASKFALHQRARKLRKPVLLATDLDEAVLFRTYRYDLDEDLEVFDGRITSADIENLSMLKETGRLVEAAQLQNKLITRIVSPAKASSRMLSAFKKMTVEGRSGGFPQTRTAATQSGVYIERVARDIILDRALRPSFKVDARANIQTGKDRIKENLSQKRELIGLLVALAGKKINENPEIQAKKENISKRIVRTKELMFKLASDSLKNLVI